MSVLPNEEREYSYDEAVEKIAEKYGVPKSVYTRMVRQESGGNHGAVSAKGASSAWQIMPATARGLGIDPNDPLQAAEGGLRILRDNYKRFRGQAENEKHAWMMAVAGYHGSPKNVEKDLRNGGYGLPNISDGAITTRDHVLKIFDGLKGETLDRSPLGKVEQTPQTTNVSGNVVAPKSYLPPVAGTPTVNIKAGDPLPDQFLTPDEMAAAGVADASQPIPVGQKPVAPVKTEAIVKAEMPPNIPAASEIVPILDPSQKKMQVPGQPLAGVSGLPLPTLGDAQQLAKMATQAVASPIGVNPTSNPVPPVALQPPTTEQPSQETVPAIQPQASAQAPTLAPEQKAKPLIQAEDDESVLTKGAAWQGSIDLAKKPKGANVGEYLVREGLKRVAPEYGFSDADIQYGIDFLKAKNNGQLTHGLDSVTDQEIAAFKKDGKAEQPFVITNAIVNSILQHKNGRSEEYRKGFENKILEPQLEEKVRMQSAQLNRSQEVSNRPLGWNASENAEEELTKRINEPGYAAQQIAAEKLANPLNLVMRPDQLLKGAYDGIFGETPDPKPSEEWVKSEKDRLLKQYGSYSAAWDAEKYYQNSDALEKGIRVASQTARSFAKNLVGGTIKSVLFVDNLLEEGNPLNRLLPDNAKIGLRNAGNLADFAVRLLQGGSAKQRLAETDWQGSETPLIKQTLFKSIQEFDKTIGDDPVLKGRLLGSTGDALGSALAFVAMGAAMPSLRTVSFWGKARQWDTALAGALQSAGGGYEEGAQSGLNENKAKVYGGIQGLLGMTEMLGAGNELAHIIKNGTVRQNVVRGILETIGKEAKSEFKQEVFQTTSGKIALDYLKDNDPSTLQKLSNALDRIPKQLAGAVTNEGLIALMTGGGMGGVTHGLSQAIDSNVPTAGGGDTKNKFSTGLPINITESESIKEGQQAKDVSIKPENIDTKTPSVDGVDISQTPKSETQAQKPLTNETQTEVQPLKPQVEPNALVSDKPVEVPSSKVLEKKNLDLILDSVRPDHEVTVSIQGEITSNQVQEVEAAAAKRGMTAAFDGKNILIRQISESSAPAVDKVEQPTFVDPAREQQLLNSITEGETLLKNKKLEQGKREMIERSVESAKQKLTELRSDVQDETPKPEASISEKPELPAFNVGDKVRDVGGRKGVVFADKEGNLHIEQEGTKARLPITPTWKKTAQQLKLDRQKARDAKKGKSEYTEQLQEMNAGFMGRIFGSSNDRSDSIAGLKEIADDDPEVEKRFREAKGIKTSSGLRRIYADAKESVKAVTAAFRRVYPRLDPKQDETHAAANDLFRQLAATPSWAKAVAADKLAEITQNLGRNRLEVFTRNLVLPDIIKDIEAGLYTTESGKLKPLPFGFKSEAEVRKSYEKFKGLAESEKAIADAVQRRQDFNNALKGELVDLNLLSPEVLNDDRYFHRQVMAYVSDPAFLGTGGHDARVHKKGFQKERTGGGDFNTDYLQAEHEWVSQALTLINRREILNRMKEIADIKPSLELDAKVQSKELGKPVEWHDLIPEGYTLWQPVKGNYFYPATSVTERTLDKVLGLGAPLLEKDIKKVLAQGGAKEQWVVPEGIAHTLDNFSPPTVDNPLENLWVKAMSSWKQWVLLNPSKVLKYNLNNMSGDFDIALAYDPRILSGEYFGAARDLWRYQIFTSPNRVTSDVMAEMQEAIKLGVIDSGEALTEIPDINKSGLFQALVAPKNPFAILPKTAWKWSKNLTAWRENALRLATYRYFQKKIASGKTVYGASSPMQIDAITDPKDKAAKLARELIGDYGAVSVAGQWLRRNLIPFYSWIEINAPRYARLLRNLPHEEKPGSKGARTGGVLVGRTGLAAAKLAAKAHILYLLAFLWNNTMFPDEEKQLQADARRKGHIIYGKDDDGNVKFVRFEGALSDALSWFGGEDYPYDIEDLRSGKATLADKAGDAVKAPINRVIQGWEPVSKTTFEMLMGKSAYPSIFEKGASFQTRGRPVRDRYEYLANVFSLAGYYRKFIGRPHRKSTTSGIGAIENVLDWTVGQMSNPGEVSYWETREDVSKYQKERGKESAMSDPTDRANALFYYKLAVRFKDEDAASRYLKQYMSLGGTEQGIAQSIKRSHPLGGIAKKDWPDYIQTLKSDQREKLATALDYYTEIYNPDDTESAKAVGSDVASLYRRIFPQPIRTMMKQDADIVTGMQMLEHQDLTDGERKAVKSILQEKVDGQMKAGTLSEDERQMAERNGLRVPPAETNKKLIDRKDQRLKLQYQKKEKRIERLTLTPPR